MRVMTGSLQQGELAVKQMPMQVAPHLYGNDRVVRTLKDEGWCPAQCQGLSQIDIKDSSGKVTRDGRIVAAKRLCQFVAQFWSRGIPY